MTSKKCPECGIYSTDSAECCDCGYMFVQNKYLQKPIETSNQQIIKNRDSEKIFEYKVVPFVASISHTEKAKAVKASSQLQDLITQFAKDGWEYVRLESLETYVAGDNGCFGFGATPSKSTSISMIVFKK